MPISILNSPSSIYIIVRYQNQLVKFAMEDYNKEIG